MRTGPDAVIQTAFDFLGLPPAPVNTGVRDKVYVEPRGALGKVTLRNPRVRNLGVALVPAPARRFLRTKILGDPSAKPRLGEDLRQRLQEVYREDSRRLETLLGEPLPWDWLRQ